MVLVRDMPRSAPNVGTFYDMDAMFLDILVEKNCVITLKETNFEKMLSIFYYEPSKLKTRGGGANLSISATQ